jgi:DNA-binding GntR family transcriptional regulator
MATTRRMLATPPLSVSKAPTTEAIPLGTYKKAVYDRLLALILELELPPGSRLVESELSARFGVSKTPIREAFLLLDSDGLIELTPHLGATVTWLSIEEWDRLVALLDAIEQPFLPVVSERVGKPEIARLNGLLQELTTARQALEGPRYRDLLMEMHLTIFGLVGSLHLSRMVRWISQLSRRYECALTHRFADTWDLELRIVTSRVENLRRHDPASATKAVKAGHRQLISLIHRRANHPEVVRYLRP